MRLPKPRFTIGFLIILIAISAIVLRILEPKLNPPRARLVIKGPATVKRGTIPPNVYRRHFWTIGNDGRAPLILVVTGTTLDTGLSLWSNENLVVPPGGQVEIKMTFGSPSDIGKPFTRTASISSNDPDNPQFTLAVEASTGEQETPAGLEGKVPLRAKP